MNTEKKTLYEVRCGKVLAREVSITTSIDYDRDALMELVRDGLKYPPDKRIPVAAFYTLTVTLDEEEAFRVARNQAAAYRVWIYEHLDKYSALLRDLKG